MTHRVAQSTFENSVQLQDQGFSLDIAGQERSRMARIDTASSVCSSVSDLLATTEPKQARQMPTPGRSSRRLNSVRSLAKSDMC